MSGQRSKLWVMGLLIGGLCFILTYPAELQAKVLVVERLFEIKGGPDSPFNQPTDVAVGRGGKIYVLDGVNHRVQVFDNKGKYLFKFGRKGSGEGELNMPVGMDVDRAGNVYVADSRNHRLVVFSGDGKFMRQLVLKQGPFPEPRDPVEVLIVRPRDEAERCYLVDNDNHVILMYDKDTLQFRAQFGGQGFEDEPGKFRYPFSLAADSDANLYVVDVLNTKVQVFNNRHKYIRKIGGWGIREGYFFRPKGVAVDGDDRVYVSDGFGIFPEDMPGPHGKYGTGVIQVFKSDGTYVGVLGFKRGREYKFYVPIRLYTDGYRLYVVEEIAHKVSVITLP